MRAGRGWQVFFFFFSSRRRHTRCGRDWSSDVCSSDLGMEARGKAVAVRLDLRGVKCPLNWARAKVRLEQMARGEVLELTLDDPRGARDIPSAAEAEGYAVL